MRFGKLLGSGGNGKPCRAFWRARNGNGPTPCSHDGTGFCHLGQPCCRQPSGIQGLQGGSWSIWKDTRVDIAYMQSGWVPTSARDSISKCVAMTMCGSGNECVGGSIASEPFGCRYSRHSENPVKQFQPFLKKGTKSGLKKRNLQRVPSLRGRWHLPLPLLLCARFREG